MLLSASCRTCSRVNKFFLSENVKHLQRTILGTGGLKDESDVDPVLKNFPV